MQHGVALLVIVGKAPLPDLARSFVNSRAVIENFLRGRRPPFIAKIYRPSSSATAPHSSAPGRILVSLVAPRRKGERTARFVAAVSGRTLNKDSFAAQKTLSFNDFSHFPNAP
jgi:hypothetical protein